MLLPFLICVSLAMPQTAEQGKTPPPTTASPTVGQMPEQGESDPAVYYLPFGIDPLIGVNPESLVANHPSRKIRVSKGDLKIILRYIGMTIPLSKENPPVYRHMGTCLLIRFVGGDKIVVNDDGVVLRGKSLSMMTPSAFLRLDQRLEQIAYDQGKGLKFLPPQTGNPQETKKGDQEDRLVLIERPPRVSIISLLSTPERYNKKKIKTYAYVSVGFESQGIYLHQEDAKHGLSPNGLWIDLPGKAKFDLDKVNNKYCIIEATFEGDKHGHFGMWSGTLSSVERLEVWSDPAQKP